MKNAGIRPPSQTQPASISISRRATSKTVICNGTLHQSANEKYFYIGRTGYQMSESSPGYYNAVQSKCTPTDGGSPCNLNCENRYIPGKVWGMIVLLTLTLCLPLLGDNQTISLARRRVTKAHCLRGSRAVSHKVGPKILRSNPIFQLGLFSTEDLGEGN